MRTQRLPTIRAFAKSEDPFDDFELLLKRLRSEKSESRFLEWKAHPPLGASVELALRLRMAKAAFSFANTLGGFIVFGVDQRGRWVGLSRPDLSGVDPSRLAELFNSYATPEIAFSYRGVEVRGQWFAILHVPPSRLMPHVALKDAVERLPSGKTRTLIAKHAVYVRYGAKSDVASPSHYERIIGARTEYLRQELLRRMEVPVAVPLASSATGGAGASVVHVTHVSSDPSAPTVRLTRDPKEASGVILHEDLAEGLFDEINNILSANRLIARERPRFLLGENVYYRIYAERHHVAEDRESDLLLADCALNDFYAPCLFWLLRLNAANFIDVLCRLLASEKDRPVRAALGLVVLLGPRATAWLKRRLDASQPRRFVFTFERMLARSHVPDRRLQALALTRDARLTLPPGEQEHRVGEALDSPELAASLLSRSCMAVFDGQTDLRSACRNLDIIAYGAGIQSRAPEVISLLTRRRIWTSPASGSD